MANKSVIIALALSLVLIVWIASGALSGDEPESMPEAASQAQDKTLRSVQIEVLEAQPVNREVIISARTDPAREVDIRAETNGRIDEIGAKRGTFVKKEGLIAKIEDRDREERLVQAKATLKQRELEYKAAQGLVDKGYQSEARAAEASALLEIAKADLERIEIDISKTEIRAPFDGFLATRDIEVGDYLAEGDSVGIFIETDPLIVTGEVTERSILYVKKGMPGFALLPNGQQLEGRVRYVSPVASKAIRTFLIEVEVSNPDGSIPAGITAQLVIPTETVTAHKVTPAVLALNARGEFGVKVVGQNDEVEFFPASVVKSGPDGVWLDGLPDSIRLIVNGQGFVREGEKVKPVVRTQK